MKKTLLFAFALSSFAASAQFWTEKATGFTTPSRGIDHISIVDDNVIWAKAYDGANTANTTVKEYTKSVDGGNTWTAGIMSLGFGTGTLAVSSIAGVSATTAYISTYATGTSLPGIFQTTDGGTTWTKQTTAAYSAASFPNLVYFFDANNGISMGDPESGYFEIYTTTNGGTNWTRVPSASIPAPLNTSEYGYVHNFDAVGSTFWFGTSMGRIYKSTDMGITWTVAQSPLPDFGGATTSGDYTFKDEMNGLMNSNAGQLWSTADGGATWQTLVPTGVFGNNEIEYIPGSNNVVSTGGATGYGSYYSTDGGNTWQPAEENTQFTVLEFLNTTTGFAGSFNTNATDGGIYKYTGTQLAVNGFAQTDFRVFPNPASDVIQIEGESIAAVTITDMVGKIVKNEKFTSVETASVDVSSLNNGVYIMTVSNETGALRTMKIVKN